MFPLLCMYTWHRVLYAYDTAVCVRLFDVGICLICVFVEFLFIVRCLDVVPGVLYVAYFLLVFCVFFAI